MKQYLLQVTGPVTQIAQSKKPTRLGVFLPQEGSRAGFQNLVF